MQFISNNIYCKCGIIVCLLSAFCFVSCRKSVPQIPTRKNGKSIKTDETVIQTIELNKKLAEEADLFLSYYANEGYSQNETGYWTKNLKNKQSRLKKGEKVTAQIEIYSLDNRLYESRLCTIEAGQDQDIAAIGEVIACMDKGDSVSLIIPWYLAYGSTGNETIEPYSNLRIELTLLP